VIHDRPKKWHGHDIYQAMFDIEEHMVTLVMSRLYCRVVQWSEEGDTSPPCVLRTALFWPCVLRTTIFWPRVLRTV